MRNTNTITPGAVVCANRWPTDVDAAEFLAPVDRHPMAGHTMNCAAGFTPCRCQD